MDSHLFDAVEGLVRVYTRKHPATVSAPAADRFFQHLQTSVLRAMEDEGVASDELVHATMFVAVRLWSSVCRLNDREVRTTARLERRPSGRACSR